MARVFMTGSTGFLGRNLASTLLLRRHQVRALARAGSESRVPAGCDTVIGDPMDSASYRHLVGTADAFVQLVGVSHPSPAKAPLFRSVDLAAAKAAVDAATHAGIRHFIYVSVAHPAPIMKDYIAARSEAEECLRISGLNVTILRPWYILGPGRRWPLLLMPLYWTLGAWPPTRDSARRLGLVTVSQMVEIMALSVEQPPTGIRVLEVPQIRAASLEGHSRQFVSAQ
ncbi:MAG TPA: NAD(P)H-binding protein [Bryobacteraceae bacterium]|jgi:uncharacterized protein YbjT (DUF2867 family)